MEKHESIGISPHQLLISQSVVIGSRQMTSPHSSLGFKSGVDITRIQAKWNATA
jgi:hypothetical protein